MKNFKNYYGLIVVALFVLMLGCGGGGGGGGNSDGSTNTTVGGGTDGFTSGATDAGAGSTIIGRVIYMDDASNLVPVAAPGLRVEFYNASNQVVGTATSRPNGYFDANIPTTAVKWRIDPDSVIEYNQAHDGIPIGGGEVVLPSLQNAFRYNNGNYFSSVSTCYTALPTITAGVLTPMPGGSARMYRNSDLPPGLPGACIP